jgi:hypothetical protein
VPSAVIWKTCGVTNVLQCRIVSKQLKKNCQKFVKVVKKLSKSCQKVTYGNAMHVSLIILCVMGSHLQNSTKVVGVGG